MDIREMAAAVAVSATVGGATSWLFREKLRDWVRAQTRTRLTAIETAVEHLQAAQSTHEGELMRVAESMERSSANMNDSVRRLTVAVERIMDAHEDVKDRQNGMSEVLARVDERVKSMQDRQR